MNTLNPYARQRRQKTARRRGWVAGALAYVLLVACLAVLLLPAAFAEEIITRGYILTVLRDALNWRWAVAITSVAFGLLHIQNAGANVQSLALVTLAGVFLATIRIVTGSLYATWMAHFAWNWVMAAVFHAPVSGFAFDVPAYRYVDAGPDWATGGMWGPEGGLPAGLAMLAGTVRGLEIIGPDVIDGVAAECVTPAAA